MRSQNKFSVISTFSGCGGSSLGYTLAGGNVLLAVEMEDNAVETYKANFPETKIYHGDIHDLSIEKIKKLARIQKYELDILDGSPPCQGFSISGKRQYCDVKNQLYHEYIRLLKGLQPKVFVMENVKGLVIGKMKLIFKDILNELKNCGYNVRVKLMNSKWYNTATSRERLIFIGVRNDLDIEPSHPNPQNKPLKIKDVLKNVIPDEIKYSKNEFIKKVMNQVKPGESFSKYHPKGSYFNYYKFNFNSFAPTIVKEGYERYMAPDGRVLMPNEIKMIQSFPKDFNFKGSYIQQYARIGNSVPPNLMKAIAIHIHKHILKKIQ